MKGDEFPRWGAAVMKRKYFRSTIGIVSLLVLGGCTTFSFAPPPVQADYRLAPSTTVCGAQKASSIAITKDYRGARDLIDNFATAYRCASHEVANGRQIFEVPSFLALVTAAIGPTFGLSDDGRLAALSGAAVYGRANSYYAPREKIPIVDAALDAVICIKDESIGIAFFDTRQGDAEEARNAVVAAQAQIAKLRSALSSLEARRTATDTELRGLLQINDSSAALRAALVTELNAIDGAITATQTELTPLEAALNALVDPKAVKAAALAGIGIDGINDPYLVVSINEQYFEMVSSALLQVERILADRLKSVGKYDPSGLQAEIAQQLEEMKAADAKLKDPNAFAALAQLDKNEEIKLRVAAIHPRLQGCVLRAKMG